MSLAARLLQFAGIVLAGIGLIYGVANNDMTSEIVFAALGVVVFVIGRAIRPSA